MRTLMIFSLLAFPLTSQATESEFVWKESLLCQCVVTRYKTDTWEDTKPFRCHGYKEGYTISVIDKAKRGAIVYESHYDNVFFPTFNSCDVECGRIRQDMNQVICEEFVEQPRTKKRCGLEE